MRILSPSANAEKLNPAVTATNDGTSGSFKESTILTTPTQTPIVNTIAGNGTLGFSGDGGSALLAQIRGSSGIAVAPDGTTYFADKDNHRIRKIDTAGVISTIAGTGVADDTGDGGLAINATLSLLLAISLDPATNNLYLSDVNNNRIRRIDLNAGTIHAFAGTGTIGFQGDGGSAVLARLRRPQGVSVAPDGSVVIADTANCRIRRVSNGIITTIAGSGVCDSNGDGGPATLASFDTPRRVHVDDGGHIFVVDNNDTDTNDNNTIRRIDAFSEIIERVAGGGTTMSGSGPATTMNIGNVSDLAVDALGNLYIGSLARVYRVDFASGILSPFAGTGAFAYSGDGGPAIDAEFNFIFGLAFRGESLVISDSENNRLRAVTGANPGGASHVVTTTNDSGTGSLREAMLFIQNDIPVEISTVTFNIPASDPRHFYYQNNGVAGTVSRNMIAVTAATNDSQIADIDPDWPHSWFSIQVLSNLPLMFDNFIFIDGNSQPGTIQNSNAVGGLNSVLKIEIAGISGVNSFASVFEAAVYRGLIVNGFEQGTGFNLNVGVGMVAAGCYIGTDPSGTLPVGNDTGVFLGGNAFTIGGNSPPDRNLISGNRREGITIWENTADSLVKGNLIGTARDGSSPLPNGIFSPSNFSSGIRMVHGPASGTIFGHRIVNNVIAFNGEFGLTMGSSGVGAGGSAARNRISQNSIHSNGGIGLNLQSANQSIDFVSLNDACDVDTGISHPNQGQNFPVLSSASAGGDNVMINGTLNSNAGGTFTIEFFANTVAESSLHGEGKTYLGSTTVSDADSDCNSSFSATVPRPAGSGSFITATATDSLGNTSEFSQHVALPACSPLTLVANGSINGAQYVPFTRTVTASDGIGPFTYSLTGQLPAGLSLNTSTGEISGTPTEFVPGTLYFFTVTATDASGCTGAIDLAMTIEPFSCALVGNAPTAVSGDLVINGSTATTINLACLVSITGDLVITNNAQAGVLNLSSLGTVGGNVNISANTSAGNLDLSSLATVFGDLIITNNPSGNLDLSSLGTVSGDLDITNSHASGDLDLSSLTSVGGNVNIAENTTSGDLDLGSVATVGGTVNIAENASSGELDISSLTSTGGTFRIASHGSAAVIGMTALGTVAGSVDISGNVAATAIGMDSLTTVAGDVTIEDNDSASEVDLSALQSVDVISIGGNGSASTVDLGSLGAAGEVTITNNGAAEVTLDLTSVAGDVTIDSTGTGPFSIGDGSPAGTVDLDLAGYSSVNGATAGGETSVSNATNQAVMSVQLPDGTFAAPVSFSITRQDPATLPPTGGTFPDGSPVVVDPLEAYQFTFGVPTLNQNASLVFEILVDGLDQTTRDSLLAAIASGTASLATLGDAPGSTYQMFPICPAGQDPVAGGCVRLELLDANRQPTANTPAIVRFTGVVGHFSQWAVAIISAPTAAPASISGRVTDESGRGIRGVIVSVTDADGESSSAMTNTFGYYKITDLAVGESYILTARSKRYSFARPTRIISLTQDLEGENFEISVPQGRAHPPREPQARSR